MISELVRAAGGDPDIIKDHRTFLLLVIGERNALLAQNQRTIDALKRISEQPQLWGETAADAAKRVIARGQV